MINSERINNEKELAEEIVNSVLNVYNECIDISISKVYIIKRHFLFKLILIRIVIMPILLDIFVIINVVVIACLFMPFVGQLSKLCHYFNNDEMMIYHKQSA